MKKIKGVYTALVTPFDEKGELDEQGLRDNLRFQISHQIDGVVVLGTTGEAPTLTSQEKAHIIKIAHEEVNGKAALMVGTGSYSTRTAIENTLLAQTLGADSALIVTPYYNRPTQEGLFRHYQEIAKAVDLPIYLYNIQGRTGQNLQTETLLRLAEIPNIVGVKEASGNLTQISEVIERVSRKKNHFTVMSGDDALTLPVMSLGGDGVISVVSNLFPKEVKALVDALNRGDFAKARDQHFHLMPIFRGAFIESNPAPIKAAMNYYKRAAGSCRLPLCELTSENHQKLIELLKDYD